MMYLIDLSWTNLSPKMMAQITDALVINPNKIRTLNMSYNSLNFKEEEEHSIQFVENIVEIMSESKSI